MNSKNEPVAQFIRRKYQSVNQALEERLLDRAAERWGYSTESIKPLEGPR
jgi:hypothetical protein